MQAERLGPPGHYPWIGVKGTLEQGDEDALLELLNDPPGFWMALLDIRNLDELNDEGCDVLRSVVEAFRKPPPPEDWRKPPPPDPPRKLTVIRPLVLSLRRSSLLV
jgi:hypothetical protein